MACKAIKCNLFLVQYQKSIFYLIGTGIYTCPRTSGDILNITRCVSVIFPQPDVLAHLADGPNIPGDKGTLRGINRIDF